jgi:hypothetical protein
MLRLSGWPWRFLRHDADGNPKYISAKTGTAKERRRVPLILQNVIKR